jgi:hypothetical protein
MIGLLIAEIVALGLLIGDCVGTHMRASRMAKARRRNGQ